MINFHRIIEIEKKYNKKLIQKKLSFLLSLKFFFKYRILNRILPFKQKIIFISGQEKTNGNDLKIMFIGDDFSLALFSKKIFESNYLRKDLGNIFIWKINKLIRKYNSEVDAFFIITSRFYSRFIKEIGCIEIPVWVSMNLDLDKPLDDIIKSFKRSARYDIKKINKNDFSWEITNSLSKFDFFYHNLCYPFIKNRHKELALPEMTNYQEIKRVFRNGTLLLIKKDKEHQAGIVITYNKKIAYPLYVGLNIKSKYYRRGLSAALFYYMIIWAKNNHFKRIRFGDTTSFINDGEFQFKRKWGLSVGVSKGRPDVLGLKVVNYNSKGISDFLLKNPFLILNKGKLEAFILMPAKPNIEQINKIYKNYFTPGILKPLNIYPKDKLKEAFKNISEKKFE